MTIVLGGSASSTATATAPAQRAAIASGTPALSRCHWHPGGSPNAYVDGTNLYAVTQRQHRVLADVADLRFVFGNTAGYEQAGASLTSGDNTNAIYVTCTLYVGCTPNRITGRTLAANMTFGGTTMTLNSVAGIGVGAQVTISFAGSQTFRVIAVDTSTNTLTLDRINPSASYTVANNPTITVAPTGHVIRFAGATEGTAPIAGNLISDPIGVTLAKSVDYSTPPSIVYTRTQVRVASAGHTWPAAFPTDSTLGEGVVLSTTALAADLMSATTTTTVTPAASSVGYGPVQVLGSAGASPKVLGIVGDSIAAGSGANYNEGWPVKAALRDSIPFVMTARGGDLASLFAYAEYHRQRGLLLDPCTTVLCQYGVNDIGTSAMTTGTRLALKRNLLRIWTQRRRAGARVLQSTMLPRTTSTDSWLTASNQTVVASESDRVDLNTWLRAGAPILNGDPVAPGTGGAVVAGSSPHPLYAVIDVCAAVEVNAGNALTQNGGRWITGGVANYATSDGLHPANTAHDLLATAFSLATLAA